MLTEGPASSLTRCRAAQEPLHDPAGPVRALAARSVFGRSACAPRCRCRALLCSSRTDPPEAAAPPARPGP